MSNYRRAKTMGGVYFFTVATYRRRKILCDEWVRETLRAGVKNTKKTHPFAIDAWVLLPDHLHCIWRLPPNDAEFGVRWAMIKRHVTKNCGPSLHRDEWMTRSKRQRRESTLWQRRFWEHRIRDGADYQKHIDYIHYNPVKHNLAECAKDWPYSTFHRYVDNGIYPENWGGGNFVDFEPDFGE